MTNVKLGKKKAVYDKRTFRLAKYLTSALPAPPYPNCGYSDKVTWWPMMMNDTIGDCTCAAAGHMIQQWSAYAQPSPSVPTDAEILQAYEAVSGYVPGNPNTDQGADLLTVLQYWRKTGIAGNKILAYMALEPNNLQEVRDAQWLFGNVYIGIQLPLSVQGASMWSVPQQGPTGSGEPGSWGGHCVAISGVGLRGLSCITWGSKLNMSWNFLTTYSDEMYAVLDQTWIERSGKAPSGFDLATLKADLALL